MTNEDKQFLANSYANAWRAVKGRQVSVEVLPHGWFEVSHGYPYASIKKRSSELLKGLNNLTLQLEKKTWKHDAPYNAQFLGAQPPKANQDY